MSEKSPTSKEGKATKSTGFFCTTNPGIQPRNNELYLIIKEGEYKPIVDFFDDWESIDSKQSIDNWHGDQ